MIQRHVLAHEGPHTMEVLAFQGLHTILLVTAPSHTINAS
jgi:hypothetical protein